MAEQRADLLAVLRAAPKVFLWAVLRAPPKAVCLAAPTGDLRVASRAAPRAAPKEKTWSEAYVACHCRLRGG